MDKKYFFIFVLVYTIAISYLAWTTPISPHEAKLFYGDACAVKYLMNLGHEIFGGFIGLRIIFVLFGFLSIVIYYNMSKIYLALESDRYLATFIYMLLPGIITAFTLANISIVVIPLVLLFVIVYHHKLYLLEALLMLCIFVLHDASVIFFVAILLYGLIQKETVVALLSGSFLLLFVIVERGVDIGGRPSGHFADLFGLYAAIFSPLLFIYFFYTMYRILLREEKSILWYISFVALVASLILSVRQRIVVTDFAPYVIISVVIMLDTFNKSLRIRLPEYQRWYKFGYNTIFSVLLVSSLVIVFHQSFFSIMQDPRRHFAIKLYEPYWLSQKLTEDGQKCYKKVDKSMHCQLRFYGFEECTH